MSRFKGKSPRLTLSERTPLELVLLQGTMGSDSTIAVGSKMVCRYGWDETSMMSSGSSLSNLSYVSTLFDNINLIRFIK